MAHIAEREFPIPFFGEMSSVNPSIIMPSVVEKRGAAFAEAFYASVTLGVGQFCTNPGVLFVIGDTTEMVAKLKELMEAATPGVMLTEGIGENYLKSFAELVKVTGVEAVVTPTKPGAPGLATTNCLVFRAEPTLQDEVFGPSTLIVQCSSLRDAIECLRTLDGQLTASVHGEASEITQEIRFALEEIAGRIIFNQFPTGVEVCEAMVHGGPFPATSDGRSTSVGTAAIYRWVRPISIQNWPG
jgi:NADP-dependent aldehyde dehydrogenase